jgi:hypothetical protein
MFSMTFMRDSAFVSWKVRTMPRRATLKAGMPARFCPSNSQDPVSGWSKPVSRLKNVVLPAPLGPIRAVIAPRWISTWSTSTAVRPPNRAHHVVGDEDGVGLGRSGHPRHARQGGDRLGLAIDDDGLG